MRPLFTAPHPHQALLLNQQGPYSLASPSGFSRRQLLAATIASAGVLSGCAFEGPAPLFDERLDTGLEDSIVLAPPSEALTFARVASAGSWRTLAVTRYSEAHFEGVDLTTFFGRPPTEDAIDLYAQLGRAALLVAVEAGPKQVHPRSAAGLPVKLGAHHVAAGTNFPDHAAAAGVKDGPFLFPKLVTPTPWSADFLLEQRLVDHEVELAFVALEPIREASIEPAFGLVLVNDVTDRDSLLRHIDPANVTSGQGFTTGKSYPTYLPVGDLFVIPVDVRSFAADVELALYVNRRLRQRDLFRRAVWNLDELLVQMWKRQAVTWSFEGREVGLFETGTTLTARSMILSGTPDGTIFKEISTTQRASGFLDFALGGWSESIPRHAIDNYLAAARASGIYLQPADEVLIRVDRLGVLRNTAVKT